MADDTGTGASAPSTAGSSPAPSTTVSSTPAAASPAAPATGAPAAESTTTVPSEPGPVPYGRFKEVNDQLKAAKEYQTQYGWAKQLQSDPRYQAEVAQRLMANLAQHPEHGQAILAQAARLLNARRGAQRPATASAEKPAPDVPIVDQQGNPTGRMTYSAEQQDKLEEWRDAQREAKLGERFGPLEQLQKRIAHAERRAQIDHDATIQAKATHDELMQQPYYKEHRADIAQALEDHAEWGDNGWRAYVHVLTTKVLPTLSQTEQQKVLDHLQTQAAGATVNPGVQTPTQKPNFKGSKDPWRDALVYYDAHPAEANVMAKRGTE